MTQVQQKTHEHICRDCQQARQHTGDVRLLPHLTAIKGRRQKPTIDEFKRRRGQHPLMDKDNPSSISRGARGEVNNTFGDWLHNSITRKTHRHIQAHKKSKYVRRNIREFRLVDSCYWVLTIYCWKRNTDSMALNLKNIASSRRMLATKGRESQFCCWSDQTNERDFGGSAFVVLQLGDVFTHGPSNVTKELLHASTC